MMPLTQSGLGDTLGLSSVHVNRTLKILREQRLIVLRRGYLAIPDWQRLAEVAQFDDGYLALAD